MDSKEFEWDKEKRTLNIKKHGVDFVDAAQMLTRYHVVGPAKYSGEEKRWIAVGKLHPPNVIPDHWSGPIAVVVYTLRDGRYRIISARRARDYERDRYHEYNR